MPLECNSFYHTRQPISIHQTMDKETDAASTASTPQDTKPAAASSDKKSFGRDVGKLVSGTVIAQVIGICLTPIITRIFNPDIYGIASVFTSIVAIITVIACMRYELAILLPKDDKDAGAIFLLCLMILVGISLLCIPVMFIFGEFIAEIMGNESVIRYLFLVPLAVFIDGLYLALRYWNTRRKRFWTQAATQALQSVSANGLKLGFGAAGFVFPGSLIASQILGYGIGTAVLAVQAVRNDLKLIAGSCSLKNIKRQMMQYRKFPLFDTWSSFINTLSWQLPVLMLTGFFSPAVAGLYTLGFQMLHLPMSLVGNSISQVFYQRASVEKHTGNLGFVVEDVAAVLLLLSVLPFLALGIIGGDIFGLIFGSEWYDAGVYVQILCTWTIIWFVTSPLTMLFPTLELQSQFLRFNICNITARFLSLVIGGLSENIYLCLILFAGSGILTYGIMGIYVLIKSGCSVKSLWRKVYKEIVISFLCICGLAAVSITPVPRFILILTAMITVGVYGIYLLKKNALVRSYIGK